MGYILFSSEEQISIYSNFPYWDGKLEYSYDNQEWRIWTGEYIINNNIYMRGVNNTVISHIHNWWFINGKNIKCQGNIENLLNYQLVINNVHPKMKPYCFSYMFFGCSSLIETPQLPSIQLSDFCYSHMFDSCYNLQLPPQLPSKKLVEGCYLSMFSDCEALIQIPLLMAEQLEPKCYQEMFWRCTSLNNISNLTISHIQNRSSWHMFCNCTKIQTSSVFSNLVIAKEAIVNQNMFENCPIQKININNKLYDINVLKLL